MVSEKKRKHEKKDKSCWSEKTRKKKPGYQKTKWIEEHKCETSLPQRPRLLFRQWTMPCSPSAHA